MTEAELKWDIVHCAIWTLVCNPLPDDRLDPIYMSDRQIILENTANAMHSVDYEKLKVQFGRTRPLARALSVAKEFYEPYIQNDPAARKSPLWGPYQGWVETREGRNRLKQHEENWRKAYEALKEGKKKEPKSAFKPKKTI